MGLRQRSQKLLRGWLPKEPLLGAHQMDPEVKRERDEEISRQLIKRIAITNVVIGPIVLIGNNIDLAKFSAVNFALNFSELCLVLFVSDVAIYLYLRRRIYGGKQAW